VAVEELAPTECELPGTGSSELKLLTPFVSAPELYRYNPRPSATMIIRMKPIFAPMILDDDIH
jgi:hypothetical protein